MDFASVFPHPSCTCPLGKRDNLVFGRTATADSQGPKTVLEVTSMASHSATSLSNGWQPEQHCLASSRVQRTADEYAQLYYCFPHQRAQAAVVSECGMLMPMSVTQKAFLSPSLKEAGRQAGDPMVKAGEVLLSEVREHDPAERQLNRLRPQQAAAAAAALAEKPLAASSCSSS